MNAYLKNVWTNRTRKKLEFYDNEFSVVSKKSKSSVASLLNIIEITNVEALELLISEDITEEKVETGYQSLSESE